MLISAIDKLAFILYYFNSRKSGQKAVFNYLFFAYILLI